jgi:hypothetical protein
MAKPTAKKTAAKKPVEIPAASVTTIRFDPAIKTALAQAAWEDRRSSSAKLRLILEDWLLERGYLRKMPDGLLVFVPERKTGKPPGGK